METSLLDTLYIQRFRKTIAEWRKGDGNESSMNVKNSSEIVEVNDGMGKYYYCDLCCSDKAASSGYERSKTM